jgi:hypothetical protein
VPVMMGWLKRGEDNFSGGIRQTPLHQQNW